MNDLRQGTRRFEVQRKACAGCGGLKPLEAQKCRKCSSTDFLALYCDSGARICDFINALDSAGAWPLSGQRQDSAANLLSRLKSILPQARYNCLGGVECLLIVQSGLLEKRLENTVEEASKIEFQPS